MNCLDDVDPANDTDALVDLAMALFHTGDRLIAGAIVPIMFKPFEDKVPTAGDEKSVKSLGHPLIRLTPGCRTLRASNFPLWSQKV
jgi:hypothetical protein